MSAASAPIRKVASKVSTTIGVAPARAAMSKTHLTILTTPPEEKSQSAGVQTAPSQTPPRGTQTDAGSSPGIEPELTLDAIVPRAPRTAAIALLIASVLGAAALFLEDAQRHAHNVEAHTRMHVVLRRPPPVVSTTPATPVIAAPVRRVARPAPRAAANHSPRAVARPPVTRTLPQVASVTSEGVRRSPVCPVR